MVSSTWTNFAQAVDIAYRSSFVVNPDGTVSVAASSSDMDEKRSLLIQKKKEKKIIDEYFTLLESDGVVQTRNGLLRRLSEFDPNDLESIQLFNDGVNDMNNALTAEIASLKEELTRTSPYAQLLRRKLISKKEELSKIAASLQQGNAADELQTRFTTLTKEIAECEQNLDRFLEPAPQVQQSDRS